jgi:hypothetical protein
MLRNLDQMIPRLRRMIRPLARAVAGASEVQLRPAVKGSYFRLIPSKYSGGDSRRDESAGSVRSSAG